MLILFVVLLILASVILGAIILIQNPKGGGLSATFGGFGNQLMGVKQTTDVLEKGTWIFGGVVAVLCIISPLFVRQGGPQDDMLQQMPTSLPGQQRPAPATQPQNNNTTVPLPGATPQDTNK